MPRSTKSHAVEDASVTAANRMVGGQGKTRQQKAQRMTSSAAPPSTLLGAAGLPEQAIQEWSRAVPTTTSDYEADVQGYGSFWSQSARLLRTLPLKTSAQ